ncbi:MAG: putative O-linked N-acetylglucosamine transferase, SPINDLY family [Phormidium sp. OSCR]|nr:MAG: putative O-linked N-acetylglucosamine transferase, SPINDLY family [Phormidium sp. OSCR]
MKTPLVTLLVPVYNRKHLIGECLDSALRQTMPNLEVVITDNASTDGTWEICQNYAKRDSRIRLFRNDTNLGPVKNWMRGLEEARGQYAKFLYSDDLISPTFLEKTLPYLQNDPEIGFVYTGAEVGSAPGQGKIYYIRGEQPSIFSTQDYITHSLYYQGHVMPNSPGASLFRLKDLKENVLLEVPSPTIHDFPDHAMGTDVLLYLLTCHRYPKVAHIPECLAFFRAHSGSVTTFNLTHQPDLWSLCYQQVKIWFAQQYQDHATLQTLLAIEWVRDFHKHKKWSPLQEVASRYLYNIEQWVPSRPHPDHLASDLSHVRYHTAQVWLNLKSSDQVFAGFMGYLGLINRTLFSTNLRDEPLTPQDRSLIAQISQTLSQGLNRPGAIQALLAATLYGYPHQFNIQYHNAPIPNWMTELYLTYMFQVPHLLKDLGELDHCVQYLNQWLNYLHQKLLSQPNSPSHQLLSKALINLSDLTPLLLSKHPQKPVLHQRAQILEQFLQQQGFPLDHQFPPRPQNRPIQLGILCQNYQSSPDIARLLPLLHHLDRDQFHIHLYALDDSQHPNQNYCRQQADQFTLLSNSHLGASINRIRSHDLDCLLISGPLSQRSHSLTLLSLHRLARIQATGLTTPTTTGMRNLDIYIGGSLTATNPDHYSEQLVTIEGSGLCFQFPPNNDRPTLNLHRSNWGLPEDTTIFISGANFRKITPELRHTWAKLLARVPNAILVLYPFSPHWGQPPQIEQPFFRQMQAALIQENVDPKRLLLIKPLANRPDVHHLLQQADIYLDSFPYCGSASVLDPLQVGLPVVALEGSELRFRQSAALLQELGLPHLIANSEASYLNLAVELANQPQWRHSQSQQIQQAMAQTPPFLDGRAFAAKMSLLLQQLVQQLSQPQVSYVEF